MSLRWRRPCEKLRSAWLLIVRMKWEGGNIPTNGSTSSILMWEIGSSPPPPWECRESLWRGVGTVCCSRCHWSEYCPPPPSRFIGTVRSQALHHFAHSRLQYTGGTPLFLDIYIFSACCLFTALYIASCWWSTLWKTFYFFITNYSENKILTVLTDQVMTSSVFRLYKLRLT